MSARMDTLRRPGRRIAELDPFAVEAGVKPDVNYGCVDWYVYGEAEPTAAAPPPQAQPKVATAGLPLIRLLEPRARSLPH